MCLYNNPKSHSIIRKHIALNQTQIIDLNVFIQRRFDIFCNKYYEVSLLRKKASLPFSKQSPCKAADTDEMKQLLQAIAEWDDMLDRLVDAEDEELEQYEFSSKRE